MHRVDWKTVEEIPSFLASKLYLFKIDLTRGFEAADVPYIFDLTTEEVERCNKFRFHKDRVRFSAARYAVRRLLRPYVSDSNRVIEFKFNDYGKPNVDHLSDVKFNISHSGKYLLIGMGREYDLGVDTEVYNATIDHLDLARSVFSQQEQTTLEKLTGEKRIHGFYRCWSMKESFIKAIGLGLQLPVGQFTVDLASSKVDNHLLSISWKPQLVDEVKTSIIQIDEGYSAAYTCHQRIDEVNYFDLTGLVMNLEKKL